MRKVVRYILEYIYTSDLDEFWFLFLCPGIGAGLLLVLSHSLLLKTVEEGSMELCILGVSSIFVGAIIGFLVGVLLVYIFTFIFDFLYPNLLEEEWKRAEDKELKRFRP